MADFTRITPRLWVGSHPSREGAQAIARAGATYALDVRGEPVANGAPEHAEPEQWAGTGVRYAYVPMQDNGTPIPAAKYEEAVRLIEQAMACGGTVFLYCAAGHDRSPSVAYAYLRKTGMSRAEAWATVQRRPGASQQYASSADRYLANAPAAVATCPKESGSSILSWLGIAAIAMGVYYLAKSGGLPRHNPTDSEFRVVPVKTIIGRNRRDVFWDIPGGHWALWIRSDGYVFLEKNRGHFDSRGVFHGYLEEAYRFEARNGRLDPMSGVETYRRNEDGEHERAPLSMFMLADQMFPFARG